MMLTHVKRHPRRKRRHPPPKRGRRVRAPPGRTFPGA